MIKRTNEERLSDIELYISSIRAEEKNVLDAGYRAMVESGDEEGASFFARKIRNLLLDESDKECALDRIIPSVPSGNSFTDWLVWLKQFAAIRQNDWGRYRQALRDLPKQKGFPFNIVFPEKPKGEEE